MKREWIYQQWGSLLFLLALWAGPIGSWAAHNYQHPVDLIIGFVLTFTWAMLEEIKWRTREHEWDMDRLNADITQISEALKTARAVFLARSAFDDDEIDEPEVH